MSSSVRDKDTRTAGPNWSEIFKIFLVRSGTNRFWSVNPWLECYFSAHQKTFSGFLKSLKFFIWCSLWYSSYFTLQDFISVLIGQPIREQGFEIFPESTHIGPLIICCIWYATVLIGRMSLIPVAKEKLIVGGSSELLLQSDLHHQRPVQVFFPTILLFFQQGN